MRLTFRFVLVENNTISLSALAGPRRPSCSQYGVKSSRPILCRRVCTHGSRFVGNRWPISALPRSRRIATRLDGIRLVANTRHRASVLTLTRKCRSLDRRLPHLAECPDLASGPFRGLASPSADAPAGGTTSGSSQASTIHHVHTGAACFADGDDQLGLAGRGIQRVARPVLMTPRSEQRQQQST